jgi:demethylmenaquinone methyltransferase/2-methoxy-6-polyprenyl-1,4-benzoquinol methylase
MFDAIAPTYDRLNHVLSLGLDVLWRRSAVKALAPVPGGKYLDLCTGSGDLAFQILTRPGARVFGVDFSAAMIDLAREKARRRGARLGLVRADALALPVPERSLDGITVAFGVRNFQDLDRGLREMARVLKPGGRAVVLEFSEPRKGPFGFLYRSYFKHALPRLGRLVSGDPGAYSYLPATVALFPGPAELAKRLKSAGMDSVKFRLLSGGAVALYTAERG